MTLIVCAALALAALGGCDDRDGGRPAAKSPHRVTAAPAARLGGGWHNVADGRISTWRFAPGPGEPGAPPSSRPDSMNSIRAALAGRRLPPRDSVRVAELIGNIARAAPPRGAQSPDDGGRQIETMVTTSPWNDHTWILWVAIGGLDEKRDRAISIEFDPRNVASFRPLGDVAALPDPKDAGGRAQMLYELAPETDGPSARGAVYAVLHIAQDAAAAPDIKIGPANFVDSIDNAPDFVRFATAVAGFAELLRGDPAVRDLSCADVIALAESAGQPDPDGARAETIDLMRRAEPLIDQPPGDPPAAPEERER